MKENKLLTHLLYLAPKTVQSMMLHKMKWLLLCIII